MNTPQYQGPGPYNTPQYVVPTPPVPLPRKPSRGKAWLTHGAVAFVALFIGTGIGSSGDADADTKAGASAKPGPTVTATKTAEAGPAPTVTETVTAKPKKTKEAGPATSFGGDGEYLVGEDIKAGTYKTAGSDGSFGCYWARLKDASGEFDAIIANNNLKGPGRVTLNKGEYFETQRCQEWKKVG
ncbi:hypothetical protein OH809_06495 [Streptomyces sp. NBC_00873]|uniref:hypothetical protein n=1 Tax=unclassified Streptomyces TaxID=2593676 RepID=UPI00386EE9C1|nr:hypothetical protein OH809_06495 [Streptomyces sp. NBC_00873]WTA47558.1 hypothetical protein OH821_37275 [Streptomyces sp. NBC_00842]